MTLVEKIQHVAKAIAGAATTGGAALTEALSDGHLDGGDLITVGVAILVGAGLVYSIPNKAPQAVAPLPPEHTDPFTSGH